MHFCVFSYHACMHVYIVYILLALVRFQQRACTEIIIIVLDSEPYPEDQDPGPKTKL